MTIVDLSADLGEGSPGEEQIWPLIMSANVACGGHTGDAESMSRAVADAAKWNVRLGAHPSYADRDHFGRKSLDLPPLELRMSIAMQLRALRRIASHAGVALTHVKPHGALYNDAHHDAGRAASIVGAMQEVDSSLALVCPDASFMAKAARIAGIPVLREAFADRRYAADGSLVPRTRAGALLSVEEAAKQAALLVAEGFVIAEDGTRVTIAFDTICIHADMELAVERLEAIRKHLTDREGE